MRSTSSNSTAPLAVRDPRQIHPRAEGEAVLCDYTLRKVLSWLEVNELISFAGLVSKRWHQASSCKEVMRRRMHKQVLALFRNDVLPTHPGFSAARLFSCLYQPNLLRNSAFLERDNVAKAGPDSPKRLAWEPTHNARGMTWAHPFDFFPELPPLPAEGGPSSRPFSVGCLATGPGSAGWSEMAQVCDLSSALQTQGIPADLAAGLLGAGLVLELSVYVAGGAIAGGEYQVAFTLLSAEDAVLAAEQPQVLPLAALPRMTVPFGHPPPGSPSIDKVAGDNLRALGLLSSRTVTKTPLQPTPGDWMRVSVRVPLPKDAPASHVIVALRGRASRNRRGQYATKFAAARLRFLPADECR